MRIKPGASHEDTIKSMTATQRRLIQRVDTARSKEQKVVRDSIEHTREQVLKALDAGVPARILAERLEVSLARIYQMRDEALTALAIEDE